MKDQSVYFKLREAASLANVIEAAESGYIARNCEPVRELDGILLRMIEEALELQKKKVSSAATLET